MVINGVDLAADADGGISITASAYGGDTRVVYELAGGGPHVVTGTGHATSPEPLETPAPPPRWRTSRSISRASKADPGGRPARFEGPRLEDAEIIVCGGAGSGRAENYKLVEELAEVLGGLPGRRVPLVDDGLGRFLRQVV